MEHKIEMDTLNVEDNDITPEEAVDTLKQNGIWERLLDGKHSLRLIVGGVVETQWLRLDPRKRRLKAAYSEYDCDGSGGAFFTLRSKDGSFCESYDEFTQAFNALLAVLE